MARPHRGAAVASAALACALALLARGGGVARAQAAPAARPPVALALDPCLGAAVAEVARVVGVELGAQVLAPDAPAAPETTRVAVACAGDARATLRVVDPLTGKQLAREVDLSETTARGRGRLLALAVVELVEASWEELVLHPAPAVPVVGRVRDAPAQRAVAARAGVRRDVVSVALVGGGRAMFLGSGWLWGGGLRVRGEHGALWGWALDARLEQGHAGTSLGGISLGLVSASAALEVHHAVGVVTMRAGAGLRAGVARLAGEPAAPDVRGASVIAPWGGPMAGTGVGVAFARRVAIDLALEAGYAVFSATAAVDAQPDVRVGGPWVLAQLAVGVLL